MSFQAYLSPFKFIGWTVLLMIISMIIHGSVNPVVALRTSKQVSNETQVYVNQLYQHKSLINLFPDVYLKVVYNHFHGFDTVDEKKSGTGIHKSIWPEFLEDLDLLPEGYKVSKGSKATSKSINKLWTKWLRQNRKSNSQRLPIPHYNQTWVNVPGELVPLFQGDPNFNVTSGSIRYDHVIEGVHRLADKYIAHKRSKKVGTQVAAVESLKKSPSKWYRILALYGLTVFDQFLGKVDSLVHRHNATHVKTVVVRTKLVVVKMAPDNQEQSVSSKSRIQHSNGFQNLGQIGGPNSGLMQGQMHGQMQGQMQGQMHGQSNQYQSHPNGFSSGGVRMSNPGMGPGGMQPNYNSPNQVLPQDGGGIGSGNQDGSASGGGSGRPGSSGIQDQEVQNPKVNQQNVQAHKSGCSSTALSWISVIMVTITMSLISFA